MKTLLLTYFQPFGGDEVNASEEAAKLLPGQIGPWKLVRRELPVIFGTAGERCCALIDALRPDAVLMLGQAAGREAVTPELAARNYRFARIPDNAGRSPMGEPVLRGGEDALFATLPAARMAEAVRAADLPAALSCSAGYYVCNDLYYTVLQHLRGPAFAERPISAVFVHVPSAGTLPPAQSAAALVAAIEALSINETMKL